MLLNVLSRPGDGCRAMQRLIRDCHESTVVKARLRQRGWELFRSLLERKIIELVKNPETQETDIRINIQLQDDFSLDQTLSLYLLDTLKLLNPEDPNYTLDLMTLVESILENPDVILRKQLNRAKDAKMAEMKMEGMDYDERMLKLEEVEYPKPNREFIYSTFNEFAARHPWVGQENIRPKSIVREMLENYYTFADYIREYELQKVEGVLLRHLMSAYKVLEHTVPTAAKTEPVQEVETLLKIMIRQVDSSLLDEWEKLRNPEYIAREVSEVRPGSTPGEPEDVTRNKRAFTTAIRSDIFSMLRGLAMRNCPAALEPLDSLTDAEGQEWTVPRLEQLLLTYLKEHERILLDPEARNMRHTYIKPSEDNKSWIVRQTLVDPEGFNDWSLDLEIDLAKSRELGKPHLRLLSFGAIGS
jgi:hypothetical protein